MRRATMLLPAFMLLAACGGETGGDEGVANATTTTAGNTPAPDGSQAYRTAQELVDALDVGGISCSGLTSESGSLAIAQARCDVSGEETVLQLWASSSDRDAGIAQLAGLLDGADIDYCYVVGRGATGTWSINAPNSSTCDLVEEALGGDRLASD